MISVSVQEDDCLTGDVEEAYAAPDEDEVVDVDVPEQSLPPEWRRRLRAGVKSLKRTRHSSGSLWGDKAQLYLSQLSVHNRAHAGRD
jgi:hypothetical protein